MFGIRKGNPKKKLVMAAKKFINQPAYIAGGVAHRTFAQNAKDAYQSVIDVVEAEREFRLNALFKRGRKSQSGLASLSETALMGHVGWANRVIDTADFLLHRPDPTVKGDPERAMESLIYAKDYLDQNLRLLTPPEDSTLDRAWILVRARFDKAYRRLKQPINFRSIFGYKKPVPVEEAKSVWPKDIEELETALEEALKEPKQIGLGTKRFGEEEYGPAALVPENQGLNGEKTPPKNLWPRGDKNEDGKCHWCEDTGTVVDHLHRWGVETGVPCHCSIGQKPMVGIDANGTPVES